MTDFHTLDEAFAEFERRADLAPPFSGSDPAAHSAQPRRTGAALVAVSVAAVVAVAGGAALLSHHAGGNVPTRAAGLPSVSGHPTAGAAMSSAAPTSSTPSIAAPTSPVPATSAVPAGPKVLAHRFRAVLGNTATITVRETADDPGDPYIKGVLTSSGGRGGYDFQIFTTGRGSTASCEDPGSSVCHIRHLRDGSSVSVKTESTGGVLYLVNLVRPDGTSFLWHLSTQTDPKGGGPALGTRPPLSTKAMVTILENANW